MRRKSSYFVLFIVCLIVIAWTESAIPPQQSDEPTPVVAPIIPQVIPPEARVYRLRLPRPAAAGDNEFSGLAWYGDTLILLPQYPRNILYTIEKEAILSLGAGQTLEVGTMNFRLNGDLNIPGFQGYEAIAFDENSVYLTIESGSGGMHSHLISGMVSEAGIELDVNTLIEIPQPVIVGNKADESIILVENQVMTLYEWNSDPNHNPVAHLFSPEDNIVTEIPFPTIPYRITDATTIDDDGRFWVINYLSPIDPVRNDIGILEQLNYRGSHGEHSHLERLLEFQFIDGEITLLDDAPLYLQLQDEARNWEGIVRFDDSGFILITDSYPGTVLAFVRYP